jgi:hypothetical protein
MIKVLNDNPPRNHHHFINETKISYRLKASFNNHKILWPLSVPGRKAIRGKPIAL